MIKKITIILLIFILTGCYDHQELNDIAILTATEINKIDNEFILNVEIVNPKKEESNEIPFVIYQTKGKTIQEAYRMLKLSSSRYIYPDHLRIVIINEALAKEDITEVLDFYLRNPLSRTEFNVLISKDENILNPISPIEPISANSILDTLKTSSNYLGISNLVTLNDLTNMKLNPNMEIILPTIKLDNPIKNVKEETYKLDTLAVFKDNKLKGYLSTDESITYNLIKNNLHNTIITYECEKDKYLSLEIINYKSTISTKNHEINIDIPLTSTINESACNIDYNNDKAISNLENNLNTYLKTNILKNINHIRKEYNSDIFGFKDIIYKYDYTFYKKIKDTWYQNTYQNIKININPQIKIIAKGKIMEDIDEKN